MMERDLKFSEASDEGLVSQFQQGSEEAFSELVRRHMERAVQIVYQAVGNYEDARDISQDAFVKIHRSLKNFDQRSKFSTWFYRVLMNASKDHHRKKGWKTFMSWRTDEEHDRYFDSIEDSGPQPEQGVLNAELKQQMLQAIAKLPEKQRWIFTLRYIEGLSIREIEGVTHLSGGTVKSSLHFASEKFRKTMLQYKEKGGS